jgi:hypothetical protein
MAAAGKRLFFPQAESHKTLYIAPRDRSALNGREKLCLIMADELSHTSRAIVALASNEAYDL